MAKKELKPAMERVNEIKNKAKNEANVSTLEVPEGWGETGLTLVVDNPLGVTSTSVFETSVMVDKKGHVTLTESQMDTLNQNTVRVLQDIKDVKDRLDTIESVLTKLVILSGNTNPKPSANTETPSELDPYAVAVEEVKKGLRYIRSNGGSRFKFEGAGPSIIGTLSKKGLTITNNEDFKTILRGTPGFTYYSVDNSFSYEGE